LQKRGLESKLDGSFTLNRLISSDRVLKKKNILLTVSMEDSLDCFLKNLDKIGINNQKEKIHEDFVYVEGETKSEEVKIGFQQDDKIGFFISDMRKSDQIKNRLEDPIKKIGDLSQLWINPEILNRMVNSFNNEYDGFNITWFSGIYKPKGGLKKSIRRPQIERSIHYSGKDGLESFLEFRENLGIKPKIIEFSLSENRRYRIDNRGIITIREGNLKPLYKPIKEAVDELEPWADAIRESTIESKQIALKDYTLKPDFVSPWKVKLPRDIYNYEMEDFENNIASSWNFAGMRNYLNKNEEGIVKNYSSQYFDKVDNSSFKVNYSHSKECFSIYPQHQISFSGGIRFVQAMRDLDESIIAC